MELLLIVAIVAVGFGAAATWLLAVVLPQACVERSATDGRHAYLGEEIAADAEHDAPRMQARADARRVRRASRRAAGVLAATHRRGTSRTKPSCAGRGASLVDPRGDTTA